jgi:hypothetical protein
MAEAAARGGGHDGGGRDGARVQDGENERNISTALVEYDADDAQNRQSNDTTLTN